MGSSQQAVDDCVKYWSPKLIDANYTPEVFRTWILKEFPQHPVALASFQIGRYPITNEQYQHFIHETDHPVPTSLQQRQPGTHPVWGVDVADAEAYCAWLSQRLQARCRLPSEAEWEYAARGTTTREYPFGDAFDARCGNTAESHIGSTTPVDRYEASASWLGVCDLAGNVEEWTSSCYAPYPGGTFVEDDLATALGPHYRILRGGSFALGGDLARCARRHGAFPAPLFEIRGFRVVREIE